MRLIRARITLFSTLLFALLVAACGDSGTGPSEPRFPAIQGTYDINAPVDGVPGARFSGNMTILDESRDNAEFSGTATVQLFTGSTAGTTLNAPLVNGTVTETGAVSFSMQDSRFRWNGNLSGNTITGTWILTGSGTNNFTGTFTAVRR